MLTNSTPIDIQRGIVGAQPAATLLSVGRVEQTEPEWCWAACGEMIARFLGLGGITQCVLATQYLGGSGNCVDACKDSASCNYPCRYDDIEEVYGKAGITCVMTPSALDLADVCAEIRYRRPVLSLLSYSSGSNHFVLLTGFNQSNQVYVIDSRPNYGEGWVDYTSLRNGYGVGSWSISWSAIGSKA